MPVNVKLGQTTVYWGEGLLFGGAIHGIAYDQSPLDAWKALATPGAEAKELFRPRLGFNANSQVSDTVNVALQYFFNWQQFSNQAWRYPESGTYLSVQDPVVWGADSAIYSPNPLYGYPSAGPLCAYAPLPGATCAPQQWLRLWQGKAVTPDENSNNYGLAVRWDPDWADATIGFYYRRTYDMQPQGFATPSVATVPAAVCAAVGGAFLGPGNPGTCVLNPQPGNPDGNLTNFINNGRAGSYNLAFGSDIDMYGISLSKNIGGMSLGAELNYRTGMPLLSEFVIVLPDALADPTKGQIGYSQVPKNDTPGAKGDTMHGLVNLLGIMNAGPWDTASWATELTWMTYLNVTQNEEVFKGRPNNVNGGYHLIDAVDKNYFGLAINFTPTWFQVSAGNGSADAGVLVAGHLGQFGGDQRRAGRCRQLRLRRRTRLLPDVPLRPEVRRFLWRIREVQERGGDDLPGGNQRSLGLQWHQRHTWRPRLYRTHVQDDLLMRNRNMIRKTLIAATLALVSASALAAVSPEEAAQLGKSLTPVGAEKAGNKEGTIPEWTGGLKQVPAGFKPGDGFRPDPYAADKPRLVITGANADQYKAQLTGITYALLKRFPDYRVDVYPTHRPVLTRTRSCRTPPRTR